MASDWQKVTILQKSLKSCDLKSEKAINNARRKGIPVETQMKFGAATNKHQATILNPAKLDRETEELKHDKIPLDLGKTIQQARMSKGWSQKELATKINEKLQVINDYEAGRGIPNQSIICKIERALGTKLPRREHVKPKSAKV